MSTSKEVTDRSVGGYNLDERDIEKAELASPYSWSSTIVEPSASTKSKVVGMEQSEAIDPSLGDHVKSSISYYSNSHQFQTQNDQHYMQSRTSFHGQLLLSSQE